MNSDVVTIPMKPLYLYFHMVHDYCTVCFSKFYKMKGGGGGVVEFCLLATFGIERIKQQR